MKSKLLIAFLIAFLIMPSVWQPGVVYSKTQDELRKELAEIERQIAEQEKELAGVRGQKQTVQNKLNQLRKEQDNLKLQIKSTALRIDQLDGQIDETEGSIQTTAEQIQQLREDLAVVIRQIYELERQPLVMVLVSNDSLAEAMQHIGESQDLSASLAELGEEMFSLKTDLEKKQVQLEVEQEQAKSLLEIQSLQQNEFSSKVQEQNGILSQTKAQEAEYQKMLAEAKKHAGEIRARLYEVAGGSTSGSLTFGEAVAIAKSISDSTGVRAAFLLAILTQESNLGKNVGTCNRAGDPPEKGYRVIMHPTRDIPKFLQITTDLGLDPETTPLSCPMRDKKTGKQIGWGGAMGPAQFIPSTWMGYKDKVAAITGKTANPWNINDAFLAAALLLKANGATAEGETGEWKAAMRYFSGSTNPQYRFYGDNVLALARRYQADLDALN